MARLHRGGVPAYATVSINDITVAENAGLATFTVTRAGDTSGVSSVDYATANNTAAAGNDYVSTSGTLTFTAGQTAKTVDITLNNTVNYENNEIFYVNLTNPVGCTISDAQGICTLTDVSGFPTATSVVATSGSEGGTVKFRVTFPRLAEFGTTHAYVLGGAATAGVDYNFTPVSVVNNVGANGSTNSVTSSGGNFVCPVNTTWVDVTFALLNDLDVEAGETIIFTVDGAVSDTATLTDSPPPTISSVSSTTVTEGDNAVFTVTRSGSFPLPVDYSYALSGTASAPSDYTATPTFSGGVTLVGATLTVPAGITSFTATYATVVNGDNGETLILTVGGTAGTITIAAIGSTPIGDSGSPVAVVALTGLVI